MQSIQQNTLQTIFKDLAVANKKFVRHYPGDGERQQPVHTLYGGAQLYKAGATQKIGELALKAFNNYAPDTHVLDTAKGTPAAQVPVILEYLNNNNWEIMAEGVTDNDGRIMEWMEHAAQEGQYRITFDTASYLQNHGFFPSVTINFMIEHPEQHYHVPLLLSPYGYSTYRGS